MFFRVLRVFIATFGKLLKMSNLSVQAGNILESEKRGRDMECNVMGFLLGFVSITGTAVTM